MMAELSEHIEDWPIDPYELLGVTPASNAQEVRRAWFLRVRKFKPDKFPQHFQRLHSAYEHISKLATNSHPSNSAEKNVVEGANSGSPQTGLPKSAPAHPQGSRILSPNKSSFAKADAAQDSNKNDTELSFFPDIVSRNDSRQRANEANRQLPVNNFLLAVSLQSSNDERFTSSGRRQLGECLGANFSGDREFNTTTTRFASLVDLARFPKFIEHAVRLLEWELLRSPSLAHGLEWNRLFGRQLASDALARLIRCRWRFLDWDNYSTVLNDLGAMERLPDLQIKTWQSLLMDALDFVAWHSSAECRETVAKIEYHLSSSQGVSKTVINHIDQRLILGRCWQHNYGRIFNQEKLTLANLAPAACTSHPLRFAQIAKEYFATTINKMDDFIRHNDVVVVNTCEPLYVAIIEKLHASQTFADGFSLDITEANEQWVRAFFSKHRQVTYRTIRLPLLEYCWTYGFSMMTFARIADRLACRRLEEQFSWVNMINNDLALCAMESMFQMFYEGN